jgi:hypothetical protein
MNINDLFCTPDQGRRLKELVPNLECNLRWLKFEFNTEYLKLPYFNDKHLDEMYTESAPALTLQELRDVAKDRKLVRHTKGEYLQFHEAWDVCTVTMTAPELAEWVIARLEEGK